MHPRAGIIGFGQEQGERGLMGDEGVHPGGVVRHQGEPSDRATAATEHMSRPVANRFQHPAYVVGQQIRLAVLVAVFDCAAGETSGVVGHDRVVLGQQWCNRRESRNSHGMAYQHQHRA